jgi:hypothetical protein
MIGTAGGLVVYIQNADDSAAEFFDSLKLARELGSRERESKPAHSYGTRWTPQASCGTRLQSVRRAPTGPMRNARLTYGTRSSPVGA